MKNILICLSVIIFIGGCKNYDTPFSFNKSDIYEVRIYQKAPDKECILNAKERELFAEKISTAKSESDFVLKSENKYTIKVILKSGKAIDFRSSGTCIALNPDGDFFIFEDDFNLAHLLE